MRGTKAVKAWDRSSHIIIIYHEFVISISKLLKPVTEQTIMQTYYLKNQNPNVFSMWLGVCCGGVP